MKYEPINITIESWLNSWLRDIGTFTPIFGGFALNHYLLGGSGWLNAFLCVMAFMWVIVLVGRQVERENRFATKQQAIEWLQREGE